MDDPLSLSDCFFDGLRPLLETPEADEGVVIDFVEVLLECEEIVGNGVDLVLQLLHGSVVLADQLVQFFQLVFVELRWLFGSQSFLPFFVRLLDALDAVTADLQDFLQDFVHDFYGSVDEDFLGCAGTNLEEPTVDLINRNSLNGLLGIVNLSQFRLNFFLIEVSNCSLVREQFFENRACRLFDQVAESFEVLQDFKGFLGRDFDELTHHVDRLSKNGIFASDGIRRSAFEVEERNEIALNLVEALRDDLECLKGR